MMWKDYLVGYFASDLAYLVIDFVGSGHRYALDFQFDCKLFSKLFVKKIVQSREVVHGLWSCFFQEEVLFCGRIQGSLWGEFSSCGELHIWRAALSFRWATLFPQDL
ncbi:hypothetical protein Droror1_Dr00000012 [Drosera rotundifolia]